MSIHSGEPEVADDRYVGLAVSRAARICASAHGGQVLLSSSARALLSDRDRGGVRDLGAYRLKDFAEPEPIFQLVVEGLPDQFPPLRTKTTPRRRGLVLVLAALLVAGVLAGALVMLTRGDSGEAAVVEPNSVGVIDPAEDRLSAQVAVGRRPGTVVVGNGAVWVANLDDETLSRIDPGDTEARPVTIAVGGYPSDLAVDRDAVWVALGTRGAVREVDPPSTQFRSRSRSVVASSRTCPSQSAEDSCGSHAARMESFARIHEPATFFPSPSSGMRSSRERFPSTRTSWTSCMRRATGSGL
jgi:hypothetical protein